MDQRFLREHFRPAYLSARWNASRYAARVEAALAELANCHVCPRNCGNDRLRDQMRACHTGRHARVSSAFPHRGEEDCLRGSRGSGTINRCPSAEEMRQAYRAASAAGLTRLDERRWSGAPQL